MKDFNPKANEQFISKYEETENKSNAIDYKENNDPFIFPQTIELAAEVCEFNHNYNSDDTDLKIEKYLYNKYKNETNAFTKFPNDVLIRYVIGYRHFGDYTKRLEETEKLFKDYIDFHKNSDFENILNRQHVNNNHPEAYYKGIFIYGQDKYGHPVYYDTGLKIHKNKETEELMKIHQDLSDKDVDDLICYFLYKLHEIKDATNKYYKLETKLDLNNNDRKQQDRKIGIYQHCVVYDVSNVSPMRVFGDRKFHQYYAERGSLLSPEIVHRIYLINAPWIFTKVWNVMSTFLHPNTVNKTRILGTNYMDELLKDIDINMIPPSFGGKGKWAVRYANVPPDYPIQPV
eukprot:50998_1